MNPNVSHCITLSVDLVYPFSYFSMWYIRLRYSGHKCPKSSIIFTHSVRSILLCPPSPLVHGHETSVVVIKYSYGSVWVTTVRSLSRCLRSSDLKMYFRGSKIFNRVIKLFCNQSGLFSIQFLRSYSEDEISSLFYKGWIFILTSHLSNKFLGTSLWRFLYETLSQVCGLLLFCQTSP